MGELDRYNAEWKPVPGTPGMRTTSGGWSADDPPSHRIRQRILLTLDSIRSCGSVEAHMDIVLDRMSVQKADLEIVCAYVIVLLDRIEVLESCIADHSRRLDD